MQLHPAKSDFICRLSRQNVALSHGKISTTMHASLELLAKLVCVDAALQDKGVRVPELGAGRHAW
jgi:hypothetical protein